MLLDGVKQCFTLEPGANPVHPGHPTIPTGKFRVLLTHSPHLGYVTPELQDVPDRTNIRIHAANFVEELLGCTAVGETRTLLAAQDAWAVWSSLKTFYALMEKLERATDPIWIEYLDPVPAIVP